MHLKATNVDLPGSCVALCSWHVSGIPHPVCFSHRALIRPLPSQQMFEHVQRRHRVFFVYIGGESTLKVPQGFTSQSLNTSGGCFCSQRLQTCFLLTENNGVLENTLHILPKICIYPFRQAFTPSIIVYIPLDMHMPLRYMFIPLDMPTSLGYAYTPFVRQKQAQRSCFFPGPLPRVLLLQIMPPLLSSLCLGDSDLQSELEAEGRCEYIVLRFLTDVRATPFL